MENALNHAVYSKNVIEFVAVANEFCVLVENLADYDKKYIIDTSLNLLSLLYLKSTMLPEVDPVNDEGNEKIVTEPDWNFIKENIAEKLGSSDSYIDFFDHQMQESAEPITSSISENMADIYQDLKEFLYLYRFGVVDIMNDALFECEQNFQQFWGQRLINSLRILHHIYFVIKDYEEEGLEVPEKTAKREVKHKDRKNTENG
jgi:hypothetical protein